jgi:hypothetical protein
MDVELETVGAKRQSVIERRNGVLGREAAAAAMCEDSRARRRKEGVGHVRPRSV